MTAAGAGATAARRLFAVAALVLSWSTAGLAAGPAMMMETVMIDLSTVEKPASPNRWLVAPEGFLENAEADAAAPSYADDPDTVFEALVTVVNADRSAGDRLIEKERRRLSYVATVPVFGFRDDVDVAIVEAPGGASIVVFSRSRVGYGDFGVNRRRVQRLLANLEQELARR